MASRDKGLTATAARDAAMSCVRSYRESMAEFSRMKTLELWYYALGAEALAASIKNPAFRKQAMKHIEREQSKSRGEELFPKLVEHKGEMPVIKDQLPTIFHLEGQLPGEIQQVLRDAFADYRGSLPHSIQSLLDRYELRDAAIKVVGLAASGPCAGCSSSWPVQTTLSSCRSRRRAPRCWSGTPEGASSPTTASAS